MIQEINESQFFAPASTDMVDGLVGRYNSDKARIERVYDYVQGDDFKSAHNHFEAGCSQRNRGNYKLPSFKLEEAMASVNSSYWSQALSLTDVLDFMPTKRREDWFASIREMKTPEFEESTVRATLSELLANRMNFLAEKVDGIFRALSGTHITNQPQGFGKRMILTGVTDEWGSYGRNQTGHINDLRQVIAKFMGRGEPDWNASNRVVEVARKYNRGEWIDVDGGAIRIRCYLNGNAHIEIHPDIAWRLNEILAHLYPAAIPSRFRKNPTKKVKDFVLMENPLSFSVLEALHRMRPVNTRGGSIDGRVVEPKTTNKNSIQYDFVDRDKHLKFEVDEVLLLLGGVKRSNKTSTWFEFDYDINPIIRQVICSGCIPDHKSHQFYPTPEKVAQAAIEMADIKNTHSCLEPSSGIGNLADLMQSSKSVKCIEISTLHAQILTEKGYNVDQCDFLNYSGDVFDRIVMNPPYSQGRWQAHVEKASRLLDKNGVLVAILPASAREKDVLPSMSITWSQVFKNQFRGASVDVVIMRAE
jgi:hypothetical protein